MADDRFTYWAADPEAHKAVAEFDERIQAYYDHVESQGLVRLWRAVDRALFSGFYTGGEIGKLGKNSEFRSAEINDLGNLHQHLLAMVTSQRTTFEARATTADHKAQSSAPLGVAVVETAMREKGLEVAAHEVADLMFAAGEGWLLKRWDPMAGPDYEAEPEVDEAGQPVFETGPDGQPVLGEDGQPAPKMKRVPGGDVEFRALHPLDVPRDITRTAGGQRWLAVRRRENRFDLLTQAGSDEIAEAILGAPSVKEAAKNRATLEQEFGKTDPDDVFVYDVYVDRGPATPDGRLLTYITADAVLFDGPLPYKRLPLYRAAARDMRGDTKAFGYTLEWDLLAPQLAVNNLHSTLISIVAALGKPTVWQPDGNGLRRSVVGALQVLQGGTTKPEVLDFLSKAPTDVLMRLIQLYVGSMERISGINATYRGQAGEGQKGLSGAAYAMFAARAIEFGSAYQGAYNRMLEEVATGTIHDYQDKGLAEYLVTLAGEGNRYRVDAFKAEDLSGIGRVTLQLSNPMQATSAGRMSLLEKFMEVEGVITTPEQIVQVVTTGRLEPATQATQRDLELIQKENEALGRGEVVPVLATDNHARHLPEHMSTLASPEARANPQAVSSTLEHVALHVNELRTGDPMILMLSGVPPELIQAAQPPAMAPPGAPGATDGTEPGAPGETDTTLPGEEMAGPVPGMPEMPTDPLSGEQMAAPNAL
jgi:hypothetical protein